MTAPRQRLPTPRETLHLLRAARHAACDILYESLTGRSYAARQLEREAHDDTRIRDLKTSPRVRERFEAMLALLPDRPYRRILDLGCAEGHLVELIIGRFPDAQVLGIDFIPLAIERARTRCRACPRATFEQLDFGRQDIPGAFDLIFCTGTLEYGPSLTQLKTIRDRIMRALVTNGCLFLETPRRAPEYENRWWAHRLAWGGRAMHDRFKVRGMKLLGETLVCDDLHLVSLFERTDATQD